MQITASKKAFLDLHGRMHGGIRGVRVLGAGLPGPCVGLVLAMRPEDATTLSVYADLWIRHLIMPRRGKLVWIMASPQSCDEPLWQKPPTPDTDMTHLPANFTQQLSTSPAVRRAQDLLPAFNMLDVALEFTLAPHETPHLGPLTNWPQEYTAAMGLPTTAEPDAQTLTAGHIYGAAATARFHLPQTHTSGLAHSPVCGLLAHLGLIEAPRTAASA